MPHRLTFHRLPDPIYSAALFFVQSPAVEQVRAAILRRWPVEDPAMAPRLQGMGSTICWESHGTGSPTIIIWLERWDPAIAAHEALHATCSVLQSRGLVLTEATEEAYTYYMEMLFRLMQARRRA